MTSPLCPVCSAPRQRTHILCKQHWFSLPSEKRRLIWHYFMHENGSARHLRAIGEAINQARLLSMQEGA